MICRTIVDDGTLTLDPAAGLYVWRQPHELIEPETTEQHRGYSRLLPGLDSRNLRHDCFRSHSGADRVIAMATSGSCPRPASDERFATVVRVRMRFEARKDRLGEGAAVAMRGEGAADLAQSRA